MPHSRFGLIEHILRPRRPLTLRLYSNPIDLPAHGEPMPLSLFAEADFPGYRPIKLDPSDFAPNETRPTFLQAPKQTFMLSDDLDDPAVVCGHYLTDGSEVVFAEDARTGPSKLPKKLQIGYSRYLVTPTFGEK